MRFLTVALVAGCVLSSLARVARAAESVDEDLGAMEKLRSGMQTPFGAVEERGQRALEDHPAPEDQGRIYYQLAETYGQGGISIKQRAEKVVEYAQQGLQCPLDPVRRLRLYMYWGDALIFTEPERPFAERRKAAAIVYLMGLSEAQEYDIPESPPGAGPAGFFFDAGPGTPPEWLEAMKRKQAQIRAAQARRRYENEVYYAHKVLVGQIVNDYHRRPYAAAELRGLAEKILEDAASVEAVMNAVEQRIEQEQQAIKQAELDGKTGAADRGRLGKIGVRS